MKLIHVMLLIAFIAALAPVKFAYFIAVLYAIMTGG